MSDCLAGPHSCTRRYSGRHPPNFTTPISMEDIYSNAQDAIGHLVSECSCVLVCLQSDGFLLERPAPWHVLHKNPIRATKVYLILLVLWKNGSGFGACTPINPKLCRSVRGWPSGPQEKKRSTKRSRSHSLVPTSAFVSIRDIRSARFSTAPDISPTKSGRTQGKGGYFSSLVSSILRSRDAARMKSGDADS